MLMKSVVCFRIFINKILIILESVNHIYLMLAYRMRACVRACVRANVSFVYECYSFMLMRICTCVCFLNTRVQVWLCMSKYILKQVLFLPIQATS